MISRRLWQLACIIGLLGVALGAFGAHALEARVSPDLLETWRTAVFWHMVHVLAALLLLSRPGTASSLRGQRAAAFWLGGILVFSGSLYALVLTGNTGLGMITPLGGLLLLTGWLLAALTPAESGPD